LPLVRDCGWREGRSERADGGEDHAEGQRKLRLKMCSTMFIN
jgi:hypothetical protein